MSAAGARSELPEDRQAPETDVQEGEQVGDYVSLNALNDDSGDTPTIETAEDGSLIVTIGQAYEKPQEGDFYANLADGIVPENILEKLSTDLLRKIEQDKDSREDRDKQYEEGVRRTGLGKDAPGGASFEGASRVVHPMMTEACVDYSARIIKELWPVAGPVKKSMVGAPTREKDEKATRKAEFLNYQLTKQIKEARAVMETTLTQVPLGGVEYIKQWWDHRLKRPRWAFVGVDDVYLPANAEGWYLSQRRTIKETISNFTIQERVDSGIYRDCHLSPVAMPPEQSKTAAANDKIEGKQPDGLNIDGDRDVYETMAYLEITPEMADVLGVEEEGRLYPYLISIDLQSKKVLALYRDWEEDDDTLEPIDHIFEFPFIPWRGAYAIGLPQIIGGLSGAATGALRALLDSAHIANTQGGLILKGSGAGSQTKRADFGEFTEIDGGGMETPDIRAKVMQFNTKEPSTVLFQLLGFLVEAGKGTIRTSMDESAIDSNANTPVGTQLSRVEEGLVVFSAIHGRIHEAFNRLLTGLHRLNRLYLPDSLRVDAEGKEILVKRSDFEGPPDVMPTSDPTIYSDQQRFAQMTALEQSSAMNPGLFDNRKIQVAKLKLWKIPDAEQYLVPEPEAHELNAVNENVSMALGKPVQAFPDQDHIAHLEVHLQFMASPMFGSSPLIAPKFLAPALQHIIEHMVMAYAKMNADLITGAAGRNAVELMSTSDIEVKAEFDKLLAMASGHVMQISTETFQKAMPVIQQAQALLQKFQPPPPMDPAQAALATAKAETERRGQADQMQGALKAKQIQQQATSDQQKNAAMFERNQIQREIGEQRASTDLARTVLETNTARDVAATKVETGRGSNFSDGSSLGG